MCGSTDRPQMRSPRLFPRDRGLRSVRNHLLPPLGAASPSPWVTAFFAPPRRAPPSALAPYRPLRPAPIPRVRCESVPPQARTDMRAEPVNSRPPYAGSLGHGGTRPAVLGGRFVGGRDGCRHSGFARPGRARLAARGGRLHRGRLSAGGGGVPGRGAPRPVDGRRLARSARTARRHLHSAAADAPPPRPFR